MYKGAGDHGRRLVSALPRRRGRPAAQFGRREAVHRQVVGRMDRDELALQVRRQLGHLQAALSERAFDLVAVGIAVGRAFEVDNFDTVDKSPNPKRITIPFRVGPAGTN